MIWGSLRRAYFSSELSVTASVIVIRNIHFLQAVAIEVPFDRILNGVGALEEFGTFLLLVSAAVGIQVFIEEFPHIIRQAEDFQIFGISKIIIKYFKHFSCVLLCITLQKSEVCAQLLNALEKLFKLTGIRSWISWPFLRNIRVLSWLRRSIAFGNQDRYSRIFHRYLGAWRSIGWCSFLGSHRHHCWIYRFRWKKK